ncbi:MAG: T9SS type A sorting domain-containing protein [Sphingobacteriales bacterium]|nr:MAG: T9SS type A sorting domain-containing protein [Sphingobacteriales bacterium]
MFYRYLTLLVCLLTMCNSAFAQNNVNRPNAYRARLIATAAHWEGAVEDTTWYRYSAGRGDDRILTPKNFDSSNFKFRADREIKYLTSFDTNGNVIELFWRDSVYNWAGNPHREWLRTRYVYDTAEKLVTDTTEIFEGLGWNYGDNNNYMYDAHGNLLSRTNVYKNMGPTFQDNYQYLYTYYPNDSLAGYEYKMWSNGVFVNIDRWSYAYNAAGARYKTVYEYWNSVIPRYDTVNAVYLKFNTDSTVAVKYTVSYTLPGQWDTTFFVTCSYDANNNVIKEREFTRNSVTQLFEEGTNINYTYDINNNLTYRELTYEYLPTHTWNIIEPPRFYYWEEFTPAAVAQLQPQGGSVKLYPVPATNTLYVDIHWAVPQGYTIILADMQGRIVYSEQRTDNNGQGAVDVSALPVGAYNIIIKGDKGGLQHGRFTVVR